MAYSEVEFTYSGGPQVFSTNFALGVLDVEHIKVYVDGQVDGLGAPIEFAFTYDAGTGEVTVTDTLTIGWTGRIARVTPVDNLLVDFEANADVTKRNLARSTKQVLMATQEVADRRAADSAAVAAVLDIVEDLQATIDDDVNAVVDARDAAIAAALDAASSAAEAEAKEASMIVGTGQWVTLRVYKVGDLAYESGSQYECIVAHTAGTFSTDLGAARWRLFAQKGAAGAGSGDMNNSDNLSGLTDKPLALSTIGGQPADADLTALANNATSGLWARTGAGTGAARTITAGDGIAVTNGDGVSGNPSIAFVNKRTLVATIPTTSGLTVETAVGLLKADKNYVFQYVGIRNSAGSDRRLQIQLYGETAAAYSPVVSLTDISNGQYLYGDTYYDQPRQARNLHSFFTHAAGAVVTAPTVDGSYTQDTISLASGRNYAVSQGVSRVKWSLSSGQAFAGGNILVWEI